MAPRRSRVVAVRVRADAEGRVSYAPEPTPKMPPAIPDRPLDTNELIHALAEALVADYLEKHNQEEVA